MKLLLINHENPLPDNFKPCLADLFEGFQLEKHAALAMKQMLCSALKEEVHLRIFSAYRSISYQRGLFDQDMQRYIAKGMSYDEAYKKLLFQLPFREKASIMPDLPLIYHQWTGKAK